MNRYLTTWHRLAAALGRIVLVAPLALSLLSGAGAGAGAGAGFPSGSGHLAAESHELLLDEPAAATGAGSSKFCTSNETGIDIAVDRDGGATLDPHDGPAATAILREQGGQQASIEGRRGNAPFAAAGGPAALAPARLTPARGLLGSGERLDPGFGAACDGRATLSFLARAPPIPFLTV